MARDCIFYSESNDMGATIPFCDFEGSENYRLWWAACTTSEIAYFGLLENGASPQEARSVLSNSLKTEIVMTADIREWRHFFRLRCSKAAHPQMQEVARMALMGFYAFMPELFEDICEEVKEKENALKLRVGLMSTNDTRRREITMSDAIASSGKDATL